MLKKKLARAFTLIELIIVIVILGILAAFVLPRFADLATSSKVSVIEGYAGSIRATVNIVKAAARAQGITPAASNPGPAGQASNFVIETEGGRFEVDFRNLCPESRGEQADRLRLIDHLDFHATAGVTSLVTNRYTVIGYDLPNSMSAALGQGTASGCYVAYDSFATPDCLVVAVTNECDQ